MQSADAECSRRTIRLRTLKRTNQCALRGERKSVERGEKDENGGQGETGTRGEEECCAAQKQIVKKSVARFGRTKEAERSEQKRPVRSPSSTPYCNKDGPTGDGERRRRCCASGKLVMSCKI